jgi:hypothetical protein
MCDLVGGERSGISDHICIDRRQTSPYALRAVVSQSFEAERQGAQRQLAANSRKTDNELVHVAPASEILSAHLYGDASTGEYEGAVKDVGGPGYWRFFSATVGVHRDAKVCGLFRKHAGCSGAPPEPAELTHDIVPPLQSKQVPSRTVAARRIGKLAHRAVLSLAATTPWVLKPASIPFPDVLGYLVMRHDT